MGRQPLRSDRLARPPALGEIVALIGGELIDLGRLAEDLQTTISAIVVRSSSPLELDAQIQLQAADALSQRLTRLAQLVSALGAEIPEGWNLGGNQNSGDDLTRAIASLGGAGGASQRRAPADEGECEFF